MNPFKQNFPDILFNEPLKSHCTYHIGGPASFFYNLKELTELPKILDIAKKNKIKFLIIGSGSNILFPDKGFKGLVIKIIASKIIIKKNIIIAEVGANLSNIILNAKENNLTGIEPLFGIPGTIGGAVFGNCGAFNTEIGSYVEKILVFNPKKSKIEEKSKKYAKFSYRTSNFKKTGEIILQVSIKLKKSNSKIIENKIKKIIEERKNRVVPGYNCGSFFKNPDDKNKAGYLIDKAGLKGVQVGNAKVSEKNANYIINLGTATQKDILKLAKIIKKTVKSKFGITLKEEVRIII
jgi:UDP-N-acetylmuramate dehydrogenase